MCREIEIYHTGDDPIRVLSTIADAVDYFGLDVVRKHVISLGYDPKEDDSNCLCGIDIDAMCTEAGFTIISEDDPRMSWVNLAVLYPRGIDD